MGGLLKMRAQMLTLGLVTFAVLPRSALADDYAKKQDLPVQQPAALQQVPQTPQLTTPSGEVLTAAQKQAQAVQQVQVPSPAPQPPPPAVPSPAVPSPAPQPAPQPAPTPATTGGQPGLLGPNDPGVFQALSAARQAEASGNAASGVVQGGSASQVLASTDAGSLLNKSESAVGVETQKRSPISNESRIRGYHLGEVQTVADGAYWFPARQDLDTFLSKIDSGSISNIVLQKGPYTARLGPGFAFIDIETLETPRYTNGFEGHGRTAFTYQTKGQAFYGRQDLWAGDAEWGARISYGQRTAVNYRSGADIEMPASYDTRDFNGVFGFNLGCNTKIEFGYMHLDQTDLDFPGQVFDTNVLITNAYRARLTTVDEPLFDRLVIDAWYNETSFHGNDFALDKRQQIPQLNSLGFNAFTDAALSSAGYRAAMTWGKEKEPQLTLGTDFRYLDGRLNEFDLLFNFNCGGVNGQNFGIPRANQSVAGGLFFEHVTPYCCDKLIVKTGARVDFVESDVGRLDGTECQTLQRDLEATKFDREEGLFLGYLSAEYKLTDHWKMTGGMATAQRPPTLTELYADQTFLAVLQNGFTTVIGNPGLAAERLYQLDVGIAGNYDIFRAGANGFYSFINDYITYEPVTAAQGAIKLPSSQTFAETVKFVNTDLAILAGVEGYAEVDLTGWLSPFVSVAFVQGEDTTLGSHYGSVLGGAIPAHPGTEPLPGIAPMEARFGLRFHEATKAPRYGVEFSARAVAHQHDSAYTLGELPSAGFTVYDIRGYWRLWSGKNRSQDRSLLLTAGVENVFDINYREHLDLLTGRPFGPGVFQPGANGYFGVELTY